MNENNELIMHVYKASDMGVSSTTSLLDYIKDKENKIKHVLESELKEYEKFLSISKELLLGEDIKPEGSSIMAKMGSEVSMISRTFKDNSDASVAEILIEGFTMGVNKMESKIKDYKKVCNNESLSLAKDFLKFQKNEIEKLKSFL